MDEFTQQILHNQVRIMESLFYQELPKRLKDSLEKNIHKSLDLIINYYKKENQILKDEIQEQVKESVKEPKGDSQ